MAAQIQQLTQLLQQQQQQQQQRASEAEVDQAKKECSVSLEQIYQISNCNLIPIFYTDNVKDTMQEDSGPGICTT
ncbi:hypothetical protein G6F44_013907 [Rhizopus delemar]|nr:hypothetical protein G6F44_013907 [Rhizopus delemar]